MKPSIPQGTRDFGPETVRRRHFILNTLQQIFERNGFQPIETPAMEQLTTLMGKYGEEGDRLIFKILNNGLHEKKETDKERLHQEWNQMLERPLASPLVTERALRYDLTIPFARFVAMQQNELAFPFRRYQMQPVWRADRPQRGRYREFWQCDCDVVGSNSLINEAELLGIYRSAFHAFNLPQVTVKVNSRKVLAGLAEVAGAADKLTDMTTALDKLDKIGWDGVTQEMAQRGLAAEGIMTIKSIVNATGDNQSIVHHLRRLLSASETGQQGVTELETTLAYHQKLEQTAWESQVVVDISLARGLNYYTGVIIEVVTNAVKMGSLGGGGRYDDLTGLFGFKGLSGVGVSFGIDRIYDVLEELQLFPAEIVENISVLILNSGQDYEDLLFSMLQQLREEGIPTELYPDPSKLDKQMKYANKRGIRYVVIAGEEEVARGKISVKDFKNGVQKMCSIKEMVGIIHREQRKMQSASYNR